MSQVQTLLAYPTNTFTIQDVILDSPVWRANVIHLEEQIDQFEKWIDSFIRALKSYIEAINKYNAQASTLCKRTFFNGLDNTLIDNKIAGNVVTKFATTLQSTIAHKSKMVSDFEELLLNPLQKLLKNDLKTFKESRKQYEKILDRYETQLYRYYVLSKQKEASALREDAFQMYEQRKLFVNTTSDHFGKLVSFKANLENLLVECFSGALSCLIEELDESNHSFQIVKERITGWKQWIEESNVTTEYQLNKIKRRCQELQDNFLVEMKPARSLKRYSNDQMTEEPEVVQPDHNKHGYLNSKIMSSKSTRASWMRRWFFLQDGWFGACTVKKSNIQLSDRIPIHEAQVRILTELDNRRFCFEVSHPTYTFHLQAETHQELQQWINTIEYNIKNEPPPKEEQQPELLLSPKNTMKSFINTDTPIVAMSTSPLLTAIDSKKNLMNPFISTTTSSLISSMLQNADIPAQDQQQQQNTLPNNTANSSGILSSWGMPWLSTGTEEDQPSSSTQDDNQLQDAVIWPTRIQSNVTIPKLTHYSNKLKQSQKDLRTLFLHVPKDEIVIESFLASLYRQPSLDEEEEDGAIDTSASYGYTGVTMITQRHIWFYSCNFMTCVNMLVIPLEKITTVRLENTYHSNGSLLLMESDESFCFGLWLESADIISEKLNYIIANKMKPVQEVYNRVRLMTTAKRTPTSRLTTSISLFASVTPLTVQAQPSASTTTVDDENNEEEEDTSVHRGSPAQGALAAVAARNQKHLDQIQKTTSTSSKQSESPTKESKPDTDWPSDIPQPQAPVDCSCTDHLEKTEIDMLLSISAYDLFTLLFQSPDMWNQLNQSKNCTAPTFTPWENNQRVMEYVMPVSNPMVKVKEAHVNETQEIQEQESHVSYVVTVTTRTPTLPYADAFLPTIKYCITYETATTCRFKCSIGVKWIKSIFVKGMVNRAAMKGMQETISGLIPIIEKHVSTNRPSPTTTTAAVPVQQRQEKPVVVEKGTSWVHLFTFGLGLVCALFTIYQTRLYQKALNQHGTITWRGVYMKDLEQEIHPVRYEKNDTAVFGLFKKARQDVTQYNYQWASKQHRHMAMELGYSRERLGAIRYELLSTFRILNRVEMQLLENEYWNWIMDKQLNCQKDNLCEALENEIK